MTGKQSNLIEHGVREQKEEERRWREVRETERANAVTNGDMYLYIGRERKV